MGKPISVGIVNSGRMTESTYRGRHDWVKRILGKPQECENCGTKDKRLDWANISREYLKDVSDWARLCRHCHVLIDGIGTYQRKRTECKNGHTYDEENTRMRNHVGRTGTRICRECQRKHRRNSYRRVLARKLALTEGDF